MEDRRKATGERKEERIERPIGHEETEKRAAQDRSADL